MKTAIIYASRRGATKACAEQLKAELPGASLIDIEQDSCSLSKYDTVIIGGNAFVGKLNRTLISYVEENEKTLLSKKLFLFCCSGEESHDGVRALFANSYSSALCDASGGMVSFGGSYESSRENLLIRFMLKLMKITDYNRLNPGAVTAFARSVQSN